MGKKNRRPGLPIEKGIPVPEQGKRMSYPFEDMEVGDSIELPTSEAMGNAARAGRIWAKRNGLSVRFCRREQEGVFRVWRIE